MNIIEKFSHYKKIILFEPMIVNFEQAKENLKAYTNIDFHQAGLSNFGGEVFFNEDDASSSISSSGTTKIIVEFIDNIVKEKVDFIKLDIEGSEQDAIDGAKNTIKDYHPILAVCIYHKAEDWYKIPEKILEIYDGYHIYLRHYMEGISETVMYFIPPENVRIQKGFQ